MLRKDTKGAIIFIGAVLVLLGGTAMMSLQNREGNSGDAVVQNGVQIIDISAKGGYSPNVIRATAGVPTELRFTTNGTYDCSSSLVIPSLGYQKVLPPTGTEIVTLTTNQATGTLRGMCSMNMYRFEIQFS